MLVLKQKHLVFYVYFKDHIHQDKHSRWHRVALIWIIMKREVFDLINLLIVTIIQWML